MTAKAVEALLQTAEVVAPCYNGMKKKAGAICLPNYYLLLSFYLSKRA